MGGREREREMECVGGEVQCFSLCGHDDYDCDSHKGEIWLSQSLNAVSTSIVLCTSNVG